MNDDRISRYLNQQAQGIALAPADPADAVRRGGRRRARRRAALVGSVAALGVLATSVAVYDKGDDQQVESVFGSRATASTFDWSTVVPASGLGYGGRTVQTADGSVYAISTAPGPYRDDVPAASSLYRSTDGAEWSEASLPTGVRSSSLAAAGDTLYSLGTSPSGGLVLSASDDGASSWSASELPADVSALKAAHGDKVVLSRANVAARDASHVVATVTASTNLDIAKYRPEYQDRGDYTAEWDDQGVVLYEVKDSPCQPDVIVARGTELPPEELDQMAACRSGMKPEDVQGAQLASYTYDELGITGQLRELVGGKVFAYVTDDGTTFSAVDLPSTGERDAAGWIDAIPLATSDGYRLFVGSGSADVQATTVLRSADGRTWEASGTLPGTPGDVGLLGDRPAVSLWDNVGSSAVHVQQADGGWSVLDLSQAVTVPANSSAWVESVSFGPLGLAATVGITSDEGDGDYTQYLVHSADGSSLEVVKVRDLLDTGGQVAGLVVTPDAIVARVIDPQDGDEATPPSQHVLVGTPS